MKHKIKQKTLGRTADKRLHLMRNLTSSLLEHGSLVTTEAKAKILRRHVEPLITYAKKDMTLARRRNLLAKLGATEDLDRLITIAQEHKDRPGGYTRLTHLPVTRTDGAKTMRVEIIRNS